MTRQRRANPSLRGALPLLVALFLGLQLVLGGVVGRTLAVFSNTQAVPSNAFTTKPDWEAPVTSSAKLVNSIGYADYLKSSGAYQVCANVTDGGNPPATPLTATSNLAVASNVITTGATGVSLSSGAFTCDGVSYNRQSASQTANSGLPDGARTFEVTATDGASNSSTTNWTVTIDGTAPSATAFATANGGATAGKMESGDTFTVTVSEATIDLTRIIAGWTGPSIAVNVKGFNNSATFGGNDGLAVCYGGTGSTCNVGGTGGLNILGRVNLGATTYMTGGPIFNATLAWNASTRVFTVALGSCTANCASVTTGGSSTGTFLTQNGSTLAGGIRDKASNGATGSPTEVKVHF